MTIFAPTAELRGVLALEGLPISGMSRFASVAQDATNAPLSCAVLDLSFAPSAIDRTVDLAMSRYDNLLRRLAD